MGGAVETRSQSPTHGRMTGTEGSLRQRQGGPVVPTLAEQRRCLSCTQGNRVERSWAWGRPIFITGIVGLSKTALPIFASGLSEYREAGNEAE